MRKSEKNIVEPDRPQMTKWRMSITCLIPKATNTHSEYVILIAFPLQQQLLESTSTFHQVQPFLKVVPDKASFFTFNLTNFSDQTLDKRCQRFG
jgi:hypothetical protein